MINIKGLKEIKIRVNILLITLTTASGKLKKHVTKLILLTTIVNNLPGVC